MSKLKMWEFCSGGTCLCGTGKYCSDVTYIKDNKLAEFKCTWDAYFGYGFPDKVRDLYDIKRRKGVKYIKTTILTEDEL